MFMGFYYAQVCLFHTVFVEGFYHERKLTTSILTVSGKIWEAKKNSQAPGNKKKCYIVFSVLLSIFKMTSYALIWYWGKGRRIYLLVKMFFVSLSFAGSPGSIRWTGPIWCERWAPISYPCPGWWSATLPGKRIMDHIIENFILTQTQNYHGF